MPLHRLTEKMEGNISAPDNAAALERLARWEDLIERLTARQAVLSAEIAALQQKGERPTAYKLRERLAEKLTNTAVLNAMGAALEKAM